MTTDDCIEGAWFCIVYVIRGFRHLGKTLEHRLVGVTDEGSHCILLRPEGL